MNIDNIEDLKNLKRVTQKEIAKRLGISRTTVARAINGSEFIKEETKFLTFMSAAAARTGQELNYDSLARDAEIDNIKNIFF